MKLCKQEYYTEKCLNEAFKAHILRTIKKYHTTKQLFYLFIFLTETCVKRDNIFQLKIRAKKDVIF